LRRCTMLVFDDLAQARAHVEYGRKRPYRVARGDEVFYVLALSPRHAVGEAMERLGITTELADPRPRDELREAIAGLTREQVIDLLKGVAK
jgi:hypothetical protein